MEQEQFEGWFIVEQMGHKRLAGYVKECQIAGQGFLRVDVKDESEEIKATQIISPSTIYCLTPCTEDVARALAKKISYVPPGLLELPDRSIQEEEDWE